MMTFNQQIFYLFYNLTVKYPWIDTYVVFFAEYLPYIIVLTVLVFWYLAMISRKKKKYNGYLLAMFSGLMGALIANLSQHYLIFQRPFIHFSFEPLFKVVSYSFPSAHATGLFALSTGVYLTNKKLGVLTYVASFIVVISRIVAGVHYPIDILAGMILGCLIAFAIVRLYKYE